MPRSVVLALLLVLAGCSGLGEPATPNQSTATTAPTTTLPETTPATDRPSTRLRASDTVDYAELSPVEQRAFDRAVQGEAVFVPASAAASDPFEDSHFAQPVAGVFRVNDYVRKDGVLYRLDYGETAGPLIASYSIRATESQPTGNETAVDFEAIPPRAKNPSGPPSRTAVTGFRRVSGRQLRRVSRTATCGTTGASTGPTSPLVTSSQISCTPSGSTDPVGCRRATAHPRP